MRPIYRSTLLAGSVLAGSILLLSPPATANETNAIPDGYYDAVAGMTGAELKAGLNDIISGNDQLSYDQAREAMKETDADPADPSKVVLIYNGTSVPADDYNQWNREHVWAKSHGDFGTRTGPGTDLHHLRPANATVNSTRNNLDFDNGGKEVSGAPGNFYDSDSFEPRDADKGDVARMILYMAVRYDGEDGFADLEPNEQVENNKNPFIGKLSILREWSKQDPPSEFEKTRNEVIYSKYQHNRNPFIDHPEWVESIWGDGDGGGPTDPPGDCEPGTSKAAVALKDNGITASTATVADCDGNASATSEVTVDITHPDRGELSIYLYAPDGSYTILKRNGDSGADVKETYTVDLSGETANGTWKLSVKDYAAGNTGTVNSWSIATA